MAFTGNWKKSKTENGMAVLKHAGFPDEQLEQLAKATATIEIKQNGDHFLEKMTLGTIVSNTEMNVGKESVFNVLTGGTVKAVPTYDGENKITAQYDHNGIHFSGYRQLLSPNEFVDYVDLDHGKVVGKFYYTKTE
uniref:Cytosolic fatty-acid binding proteins domain-containing protein n=1 Tax=Ciona savignyi TaxID=51511 RepID=H2YK77_CIOSA